jgi:hypothetical protein
MHSVIKYVVGIFLVFVLLGYASNIFHGFNRAYVSKSEAVYANEIGLGGDEPVNISMMIPYCIIVYSGPKTKQQNGIAQVWFFSILLWRNDGHSHSMD